MSVCPSCLQDVVEPYGFSDDILVIGDAPDKDELKTLRAFTGSGGKILRAELAELGVDLVQARRTNLWLHAPSKNENCFDASLKQCLESAKGKKGILLMGSIVVNYFTGYKVREVSGLQVTCPMLSAPIIYASVSPSMAYNGTIGEMRFAITNFVNHLRNENIL